MKSNRSLKIVTWHGSLVAGLAAFSMISVASANTAPVLEPIAQVGENAPGTADTWTGFTTRAAIGSNGGLIFTASTSGGAQGWWYGEQGSLTLASLLGQAAPGGGGATFGSFLYDVFPYTGGLGEEAIFATRLSDGNDAIYTTDIGPSVSLLVLEGGVAPGTGANFNNFQRISANDAGDYAFASTLTASPFRSLWRGLEGAAPDLIARQASNMNAIPGSRYNVINDTYSINGNSTVVFRTNLTGTTTDTVLLALPEPEPPGGPVLVAREGDLEPGGPSPFLDFTAMNLNDSEDVLFRATLGGGAPASRNTGVWFYDSATTTVSAVAVEGGAAPGAAGAFFDSFEEIFLANNGTIAFVAIARDTANGTGSLIGRGVWMDAGGGLELVALVGQNVFGKDGSTVFGPVNQVQAVSMNNQGDLILQLRAGSPIVTTLHVREASPGVPARMLVAAGTVGGDVVYGSNRVGKTLTALALPELEGFSAYGGGPNGRSRVFPDDGRPLITASLDGAPQGLCLLDLQAISFLVTSTNEEAPGAAAGTLFETIRPAGTVNADGLIAFRAHLEQGSGDATNQNFVGIWAEIPGVGGAPELTLVARQGDAAPGGDVFANLDINPVYGNNLIAFPGLLQGGGQGLYAGAPDNLQLIARTGDAVTVTGLPVGSTYSAVRSILAYNNSQRLLAGIQMALDPGLSITGQNNSAVVRFGGASPLVIAREGGSVLSGAVGVFGDLLNCRRFINSTNRSVILAQRRINNSLGITATNSWGIWYHNGTTLSSRVAVGGTSTDPQLAPSAGGAQYLQVQQVSFNDSNRIAFLTTLQGAGVIPGSNNWAMYVSNAGAAPVLAVRTGQAQSASFGPAGVDPDARFVALGHPRLKGTTELVYRANLLVGSGGVTADDDAGIWSSVPAGATTLLLREGDFAPDANGAASAQVLADFDHPVVSPAGRIVVGATLRSGVGGVTAANDRVLLVQSSDGSFSRVVQEGQTLDIADGLGGSNALPIRNITYMGSDGASTGSYNAMSGNGFVLTYLEFSTGEIASVLFLVP